MMPATTTAPASPRSVPPALTYSDSAQLLLLSLLPGAATGAVQAVLGHPFDTIKTRTQSAAFARPAAAAAAMTSASPPAAAAGTPPSSSLAVARSTYERGGLRAFYRGVSVPLLVNMTKRSLQYAVWDRLKERRVNDFAAGAIVGAFGTIVIGCPAHVIKIHSQIAGRHNALQSAVHIFRSGGLRGFFAGLRANRAKDVVFASVYLGLYERYKTARPLASYAEAACVASVSVWLVFQPLDTVKTVCQSPARAAGVATMHAQLAGVRAGAASGSASAGAAAVTGLMRHAYAGLGAALVRAGPANAASMSAYEWVKAWSAAQRSRIQTPRMA